MVPVTTFFYCHRGIGLPRIPDEPDNSGPFLVIGVE